MRKIKKCILTLTIYLCCMGAAVGLLPAAVIAQDCPNSNPTYFRPIDNSVKPTK